MLITWYWHSTADAFTTWEELRQTALLLRLETWKKRRRRVLILIYYVSIWIANLNFPRMLFSKICGRVHNQLQVIQRFRHILSDWTNIKARSYKAFIIIMSHFQYWSTLYSVKAFVWCWGILTNCNLFFVIKPAHELLLECLRALSACWERDHGHLICWF